MSANKKIISSFKKAVPKLTKELHKGQNGRIGIIGGCKEYKKDLYMN